MKVTYPGIAIQDSILYIGGQFQNCGPYFRYNAAAVIFAHNHPSGVLECSQADELITHRLIDALTLVDIRVLDHFVIGGGQALSFAERGLL